MRDVTALGGFTLLTLVTVVAAAAFLIHRKVRHALVLVVTVLAGQAGFAEMNPDRRKSRGRSSTLSAIATRRSTPTSIAASTG